MMQAHAKQPVRRVHQAIAIGTADCGAASECPPLDRFGQKGRRRPECQLADTGAAHRADLGIVARRPGAEQEGDIAGIVGHRRRKASHGAHLAIGLEPLARPGPIVQAIAPGEVVTAGLERIEGRARHAERLQERAPHVGLIGLATDIAQDTAEQRIAEIAVLEGEAGRPREELAGRHQLVELGRRHAQHPVAPGIVGDEACDMGQQIAHADRPAVERRRPHLGELRHVLGERRIERQAALVAQRQDRERRHVLGHRGDAEGRLAAHCPLGLAIGEADGRHMGELAVLDDAGGEAGKLFLLGKSRVGGVYFGKDLR